MNILDDKPLIISPLGYAHGTTSPECGFINVDGVSLSMKQSPLGEVKPCVAICTLADDELKTALDQEPSLQNLIIGALHTENLGIEHLICYCLENPEIRYIIVCGIDGQSAIGHLPGQSFLSLGEQGVDEQAVIIGAMGKRPVLQNLSMNAIEHFRNNVTLVNLLGCQDIPSILAEVDRCSTLNPGPGAPFLEETPLKSTTLVKLEGYVPETLICDPNGYFVIYVDSEAEKLVLEHYKNNGLLMTKIEGPTGRSIYHPAIDCGLLSRMDHAAYLGRELERAEFALKNKIDYVQDAEICD
ncbi:MAG: DUF4346 domain-containing protein [Cyanobacteria bacterium]|nr:DUF4346 domain-containing protein [Cyanobacteriota bacterium]